MTNQEMALWLVDCPLPKAVAWGASRLERTTSSFTPEELEAAQSAGLDPLVSEEQGARSLLTGKSYPLPPSPESMPWKEDRLRRLCSSQFFAAHPENEWCSAPRNFAPASSLEAHRQALRMQLLGGWVGGAQGIRIGPWPTWCDSLAEEIDRWQGAQKSLSSGQFQPDRVQILEPDSPTSEDLRRVYEAWILLQMAGVTATRLPARHADRKSLNRAQLVVIPGCWNLPEKLFTTLGGWVRGGGTLYLGFDERALETGFAPQFGPPGPEFLERLVGRKVIGVPPYASFSHDTFRLRFQKQDRGFGDIRELYLHDLPPLPFWPLEPLPTTRARKTGAPKEDVEVLALGEGQEVMVWKHRLKRGTVIATALPLEAILSSQTHGFSDLPGSSKQMAPMGPPVSRFFFHLAKTAGLKEGKAPMEPFTHAQQARSKGGFPHGVVVINRRGKRSPGQIAMEVQSGFEAKDLQKNSPVALMKGKLVCPVGGWDYRVVGLARRSR